MSALTDRRTTDAVNAMLRKFRALPEDIPRAASAAAAVADQLVIPTVLVAAVNARPEVYATADFKCGGVSDHFEIQAANDLLNSLGIQGRIVLSEGDFVTEEQVNLDTDQQLMGMGWGTYIHADTGSGFYVVYAQCSAIIRDFRASNSSGGGVMMECICA